MMKFLLFVASTFVSSVSGLTTGAAGCNGGEAAVSGLHLTPGADPAITGTLAEAPQGLVLQLNGAALSPDTPADFTVGETNEVKLMSTDPFKGFLLRLASDTITDDSLSDGFEGVDDGTTQVAGVCASPATGLTHRNSEAKTEIVAELELDEAAAGLTLDVTVVITNSGGASEYYYSGYTLNAVAAAATTDEVTEMTDEATDTDTDTAATATTDAPAPAEPAATTDAPAPEPETLPETTDTADTATDAPDTTANATDAPAATDAPSAAISMENNKFLVAVGVGSAAVMALI